MHPGEYYALWMKAAGYTQGDVVRATGLSSSQVSHFINGKAFLTTENLLKLTRFAEFSVEELYTSAQNNQLPSRAKKTGKQKSRKRR